VPVTSSNLATLSGIAGFDLTTLFNEGFLNIPDGQFGFGVLSPADKIARAIVTAGVDPVQYGIPLYEALAQSQYDNLSSQSLIQALVAYARQAGVGSAVAGDVGTAIASLVQAGTLTATEAVSYVVQAADAAAKNNSTFGTSIPSNPYLTGEILGTVLGQLA